MAESTTIPWCHHTHNPWWGCTKISAGCTNCYAADWAHRWGVEWGPSATRRIASEATLRQPFKWDRDAAAAGERRRVFSLSMGDIGEDAPELDDAKARLFATIWLTPNLDWLLLTTRPKLLLAWLQKPENYAAVVAWVVKLRGMIKLAGDVLERRCDPVSALTKVWGNVWYGVTVENHDAVSRIADLEQLPGAVRFLSIEPLIQGWSLRPHLSPEHGGGLIDWVIVGGESGSSARRCDAGWVRDLVSDARGRCKVFVKQLGAYVIDRNDAGWNGDEPTDWPDGTEYIDDEDHAQGWQGERVRVQLRDKKGAEPSEWPEDLRVRQFPTTPMGQEARYAR